MKSINCKFLSNCTIFHCNYIKRFASSKPKFTVVLSNEAEHQFEAGQRYRLHPGRRKIPCVYLPQKLESASLKALAKYNSPRFKNDCETMFHRMHAYQMPYEKAEIRERVRQFMFEYLNKNGINLDSLTHDEKEDQLSNMRTYVDQRIHGLMWKPNDYTNEYTCALALAACLGPNYASLISVFSEIAKGVPNFKPETLFDFGSGFGTTIWASEAIWPKSINEFFCVDISSPMNELSQLLLKGGDEDKKISNDRVFYRQFLPASHNIKYDLVVSAFSLLELPDARNRIQVIENLWHKTQDMLVIIENGNRSGFASVLEARNLILQMSGHKVTSTFDQSLQDEMTIKDKFEEGHVVAPCPHDLSCPRQFKPKYPSCKFEINYFPLNYNQRSYSALKERYSYVVLRKGPKQNYEFNGWPRIISPVLPRHNHVICRMCCSDGNLHEVVFSKSKHKGHIYKCAKISRWGDLIPGVVYPDQTSEKTFGEEFDFDEDE